MALQLQMAALAAFAALMMLAAFEDLRRLIIPNPLIVALLVLWPLSVAAAPTVYNLVGGLACGFVVFVAGALCFSRGWLGGGDVKLLAVAALWAGPTGTPTLLLLTGILGGILALFLMVPPGAHIAALTRAKLGSPDDSATHDLATPVPYGIAIAGAAVIVTLLPHFR
jgi:prepilin peptidase CpaA